MKIFEVTKVYADVIITEPSPVNFSLPREESMLFYAGIFTVVAVILAVILLKRVK